ncbi:Cochaperone protein [Ophidiomyces ophidiicola]|nr:Cochaperone protein [Ophidiomyces ophidiicola]
MDFAAQGAKAISASNFPLAIQNFTQALTVNPHATDYYIKRSTAYLRLKPADGGPDFKAALRDAEMAVALGIRRARRELILAGQLRRAIVLYQMNQFGDADFLFRFLRGKIGHTKPKSLSDDAMSAMNPADKSTAAREASNREQELTIWEIKVASQLQKLAPGDEKAKVTVEEIPSITIPDPTELKKLYQAQLKDMKAGIELSSVQARKNEDNTSNTLRGSFKASTGGSDAVGAQTNSTSVEIPSGPQDPASKKYRHEWYQNHDTVVVTLYAKGVPKDKAEIEIQERSLSITFPTGISSDSTFSLDPLFAAVDVEESKSSVMSTKVEIILRKRQPGQKWASLESSPVPSGETVTYPVPSTSSAFAVGKAPAYPTSARGGAKDWDKVAAELSAKKATDTSDKSKDADADSDLEEYNAGDPVDAFFKKLYANADDDTRRAMMKSYYESKGTALSTNWSEVGKGPVQEHPPGD